jgi:site-specific recombinase
MNHHRPDLAQLLTELDATAPLAQRHLWLIAMLEWVRGPANHAGNKPAACVARVELMLQAVSARPDCLARWHTWWQRMREEVDMAPMLADFGFAPRTAFLSELGHRLNKRLLPTTPETTDMAELFELLFPSDADMHWLRALPADTLKRMHALLFAIPTGTDTDPAHGHSGWEQTLMDALTYCVSQVSSTGFASEIRLRLSPEALRLRAFHQLPMQLARFHQAVQQHGARSTQALVQTEQLRQCLDDCRHSAASVYAHLDEHGISVGIVFRLRQLRERMVRIRQLLDCLHSQEPAQAAVRLTIHLIQAAQARRSIRALVATSSHLTAAKVAERSAESGEHYITRNRSEYATMLRKAAGGGAIIGLTTWGKFLLYGLALSPFWLGLGAGLNYALSFVVVQLLHLTVATKQPAVTAPAMAAKLKHIRAPGAVNRFVDEVAHLFRSQVAAIAGNLLLVGPVVVLISLYLQALRGQPMIDVETANHVLHSLNVLGPSALFAAFTGVLLFASSIVAGWFENWFVLHRLESAMAHNPRLTRRLGASRAQAWAHWLRANVSGLAANVSLGLMLGLVPAFAAFFGLGLEVRHVTLSAGQVAAAVAALGTDCLTLPAFWMAVLGVAVVGPINLGVSFYLAFWLALKAQAINDVNRRHIRLRLWQRVRRAPLSFLLPPPEVVPAAVPASPARPPEQDSPAPDRGRHG